MTYPSDPNQPYQQQPQPGTPPPPPPPAQGQYVPPAPAQPAAYPPPQAPPQPYGAPAYAPALPESQAAKNAMIWGIVGIVACFVGCGVLGLLGIPGITFGNKAKKEIAASGGRLGGESNANLGVILGWISTVIGGLSAVFIVIYFIFIASILSSVPTT